MVKYTQLEFLWESDSIEVSSVRSDKDDLSAGIGADGYILAWDDALSSSPDIYTQRVNADGSLGEGVDEPRFGDINGDGSVSIADLLEIIAVWGKCSEYCSVDLDEDGTVGVTELLELITAWGDCA